MSMITYCFMCISRFFELSCMASVDGLLEGLWLDLKGVMGVLGVFCSGSCALVRPRLGLWMVSLKPPGPRGVQPEGLWQWCPNQGERTREPGGGRNGVQHGCRKGSGIGGRSSDNECENQQVVSRRRSMAGAYTCSDQFSLVSQWFEPRSVTLEPPGPGGGPVGRDPTVVAGAWRTNMISDCWSRRQHVRIEHAGPLGSIGLNGAGEHDDEITPTGGEDV
ncbi:hypothetical protein F511_24086 [Dorcoceras hygrometricum]|uniref:Uncharacterized protein n=1 Tax=Dorcoceras hygrometricum TaxID=472368 RepID=A0A2Z7B735_9LAMI|nr:hypothetical protein F511_24086 [Dorcoceras hygrometricum]